MILIINFDSMNPSKNFLIFGNNWSQLPDKKYYMEQKVKKKKFLCCIAVIQI